jgi:hypothetical protein
LIVEEPMERSVWLARGSISRVEGSFGLATRSTWLVTRSIGLLLAALAIGGCGKSSSRTCSYDPADGRNRSCTDFQAGYSDEDVGSVCTAQGWTLGSSACEAGYSRCVIASDGRMFTMHFYEPGDSSVARMICTFSGGTFDGP